MNRLKFLTVAATSWLPLLTLAVGAQATTYNAAADWATTYSTATAASTGNGTWGLGGAWSAGSYSANWTNQETTSSNAYSLQTVQTYYNAGTVGNLTTGTGSSSGTFSSNTSPYTVPWQFYQYTPGTSYAQQVGQTLTQQIASAQNPHEPTGQSTAKITLPSGVTSNGSTSGTLELTAQTHDALNSTSLEGFTNNANQTSFNDGSGSEQDAIGVYYNYSASSVHQGALYVPSSATTDTLFTGDVFGPDVIRWTAPESGFININTTAYDTSGASDGTASFYVIDSHDGPSSPLLSVLNYDLNTSTGYYVQGSWYSGASNIPNGVLPNDPNGINYVNGTATLTAASTAHEWNSGTTSSEYESVNWQSGQIYVTAGETIDFVWDSGRNQFNGPGPSANGNRPFGGATDPFLTSAVINFETPEPASIVLLGIAVLGLAFTSWKRSAIEQRGDARAKVVAGVGPAVASWWRRRQV